MALSGLVRWRGVVWAGAVAWRPRHARRRGARDVGGARQTGSVYLALARGSAGITLTEVDGSGIAVAAPLAVGDLSREVARRETTRQTPPRWVWDDTTSWYSALLESGVRVERCVDLRLCRAILRNSSLTADSALAQSPRDNWDTATPVRSSEPAALFDVAEHADDPVAEFARQRTAIAGSGEAARIGLLLAAESAGALVAAEMRHVGLPWRRDVHEQLLVDALGERPAPGQRPAAMEFALRDLRRELDSPDLNPDSPPELLRALSRAGIHTESTRSWELERIDHPAIPPLLEYKRLARLLTASGWSWLDANISGGRFHPEFVPGGVVTGRWASRGGGGALQLPKQVRSAVVADAGWKLVVADAAQLEPRILAALSQDDGMAAAGAAGDLYEGIVASGAVDSRAHAKMAMLGAMYGATSGEAGRLLPRLARTFPRAIGFVEDAARAGESGGVVTTRLGRSSPPGMASGYDETASAADVARARGAARSRGRFTRNFVVQGSAAEWALCWMAGLRGRLRALDGRALDEHSLHEHTLDKHTLDRHTRDDGLAAHAPRLADEPHLVFFLHDEVVVHCPEHLANAVVHEIREAAADAGRLLFGSAPVTFPVSVTVVDNYGQAK